MIRGRPALRCFNLFLGNGFDISKLNVSCWFASDWTGQFFPGKSFFHNWINVYTYVSRLTVNIPRFSSWQSISLIARSWNDKSWKASNEVTNWRSFPRSLASLSLWFFNRVNCFPDLFNYYLAVIELFFPSLFQIKERAGSGIQITRYY